MNRVNTIDEVVVPIKRKRKSWAVVSLQHLHGFARNFLKAIRKEWNAWNERWRAQALKAAQIESIRVQEQERIHERFSSSRWYGHF